METILDNWIEDMPSQFHDRHNIEALVRAFSKQLEEIQQVYDDIDKKTDIDTAVGKNLDGVGTIVDLSRKDAYVILRKAKDTVIDDETYRAVLRYKRLQNTSECTYYDIIESIHMLWDAESIHYAEYWGKTLNGSKLLDGTNVLDGLSPATIHISVDDANIDGVDSLLGRAIALKPAGVHMTYESGYKGFFDWSDLEDFDTPFIKHQMKITEFEEEGLGAKLAHKGWGVSHRTRLLDGSKLLDGSAILDGIGGMDADSKKLGFAIKVQNEEDVGGSFKTRYGISFFKVGYLDGKEKLDGSHLLDSKIGKVEAKANHIIGVADEKGGLDHLTVETFNRGYAFLTGWKALDGTRMLNSIYRKEEIQ